MELENENLENKNEDEQAKVNIRIILRIGFAAGLLCCIGWFIYYLISLRSSDEQVDALKDKYVSKMPSETLAEEAPVESEEAEPEPVNLFGGVEYDTTENYEVPELTLDFKGMQEECEDLYAWIYIPDTKIDYPVLQKEDDAEYYLQRDIHGNRSASGSIFTQYYNSTDWTDPNTVIYGHNMKNGSMFATLHYFEDSVFFEEHPYVYIFTPEYTLVYQIFGAYEFSNIHLMMSYDFKDHDSFQMYLDRVFERNGMKDHFNRELEVTADDRIITLSTCVSGQATNRYMVQAKLVAVEQKESNEGTEAARAQTE